MIVRETLLRLLACPMCHGELSGLDARLIDGEIACSSCGASYAVRNAIPILLPPALDATHVHDELDHHAEKQRQTDYYDRVAAAEFEITRPHDAPEAYRWLLARKFERGVALLPPLKDATVVDVCCGSGMDAEMLVGSGARVIAIDISEGCALRAKERAERYGLDYVAVVADAEHLPLADRAADIGYVHDGLHHLPDPADGLRELARVSRLAISVNEPAQALSTAIAVRLGVALAEEAAGNRVGRLRAREVAAALGDAGFDTSAGRYLMYYKHHPGAFMHMASRPLAGAAYRRAVALADAALGRWGNKINITATRRAA